MLPASGILRGACASGKRAGGIAERNIGIEVFQRPPDYDTAGDATVRVTANEVRKRLAQYYQQPETRPDVIITLAPGSYGVTFCWKPAESPAAMPPVIRTKRWPAIAALLLAASAGAIYATRGAGTRPEGGPLWSTVFRSGQKTNIIVADAARYEILELLGRDFTLRDYLSSQYPGNLITLAAPEMQRVIGFLGTRQTTSVGSTTIASRLVELGKRQGANPVIRHPRHVNAREFKTDNFILLGSRLSVPWVELFEPSLNYPLKIDAETGRYYLENRSPRPGEPSRYWRSARNEETYADIAVLPNIGGSGVVLIFNAIDMMGVEAAGELAMATPLALEAGRFTEILLRVRSIEGTVSKAEVVAVRKARTGAIDSAGLASR